MSNSTSRPPSRAASTICIERREPQLPVRNEAEHVDRGLSGLQALEVAARTRPVERHVRRVAVDRLPGELRVADREAAEAAVADHLRRHALMDRARRTRVDEQ